MVVFIHYNQILFSQEINVAQFMVIRSAFVCILRLIGHQFKATEMFTYNFLRLLFIILNNNMNVLIIRIYYVY